LSLAVPIPICQSVERITICNKNFEDSIFQDREDILTMLRTILLTSLLIHSVALDPVSIGIGLFITGAVTGTIYSKPDTYFKGEMSVCRQYDGPHKPQSFLGLTTCVAPGYRIKLSNKVGFKEAITGTTSDGKTVQINVDTVLYSSDLEEQQLRLSERHNPDEDFAETLLKKPLRYCLQKYISEMTSEELKKDRMPNTTYSTIMTTCMEEYETTFKPMNMYAAMR